MARSSSRSTPAGILIGFVLLLLLALWTQYKNTENKPVTVPPGDYLFCFWNVENLFDDQLNGLKAEPDSSFDNWFADSPGDFQKKLSKLREVLLSMNAGKGPDILALAEVENARAVELLRDELNRNLPKDVLPYDQVLFKEVKVGRHIAPAILTRLPVVKNRTRQLGKRSDRILEGRINIEGKELVVIVAHWTSRLTDKTGDRRAVYADRIYGAYKGMYRSNPDVDVLVCGDFNDNPDDPSLVQHLHSSKDEALVRQGGQDPFLLNLFAGKSPTEFGTLYYRGWNLFDQILVSPGMLNEKGWRCDPNSARTINSFTEPGDRLRRPWAFGERADDPTRRGYSDHFPVTVTLSVNRDSQVQGEEVLKIPK